VRANRSRLVRSIFAMASRRGLDARLEVLLLTGEEAVPLGDLGVLLDGGEVDLPQPLQLSAQVAELLLLAGLQRPAGVEAVQLLAEVGLVPLVHRADQVLHLQHERALAQGDLPEPLGDAVQPRPLVAEAGLVGARRAPSPRRAPAGLPRGGRCPGEPLQPAGVALLGGGDPALQLLAADDRLRAGLQGP
jgi:hypothetical protein